MESIKVTMRHARDTKNTHRYDADPLPSGVIVSAMYLPKILFQGSTRPDTLTVTVEPF